MQTVHVVLALQVGTTGGERPRMDMIPTKGRTNEDACEAEREQQH